MGQVQCMTCKKGLPCLCHLTRYTSRRSMAEPSAEDVYHDMLRADLARELPPLDEGALGRLWEAMQRVQRGEDEAL